MHNFDGIKMVKIPVSQLAKKSVAWTSVAGLVLSLFGFASPLSVAADTNSIDFESPTYNIGNINGQDGWTALGSDGSGCAVYDEEVADSLGTSGFGDQSFRISDAVTSGCFSDQAFAKPVTDAAGEADSTDGTFSRGTLQSHFETQFDIASTKPNEEQPGLHISVSPDRGDGSRMSYLRFEDSDNGIDVFFDDVQGTDNPANFVETQIADGLNRTMPHSVKLSIDFVDGPSNDVVKVWIDGILMHTGTSWENYYRYDSESSAEQSPRIVKTVLFRASGVEVPADNGFGFLFDNLNITTGVVPDQTCTQITLVSSTDTNFKGLTETDPAGSSTDSLFNEGTSGPAVVAEPTGFPGAWDAAAADPDVAGANWVNNETTQPTNPAGPNPGEDGTVDAWRLFSQSFTIPADADLISSPVLHFTSDNSVQAFLDNSLVGTATTYTTVEDSDPIALTPGIHEFEFVVKNDAYDGLTNPTGLIYKTTINYCEPNPVVVVECPAAPAVAAAYLKQLGVKAGSTQYKNIISQVAQHMGPQTFFDGVGACNPAYGDVVKAYVDNLINFPTPKK